MWLAILSGAWTASIAVRGAAGVKIWLSVEASVFVVFLASMLEAIR